MASKLHINLSIGLVEVEGEENFVRLIYEDIKTSGLLVQPPNKPTPDTDGEDSGTGAEKPQRAKRTVSKRSGPSCATRISELREEGLFAELRDAKAVGAALAAKGHNYEGKHISAALITLTKNGTLRRVKREGVWMYQLP